MRGRFGAIPVALLMFMGVSLAQQPTETKELAKPDDNWARLGQLPRGQDIHVLTRQGVVMIGQLESFTPDNLRILGETGRLSRADRNDVSMVAVRKRERWKRALLGAGLGFGIGFGIGAGVSSYIADRNDPPWSTRAESGAIVGLPAAGIGALIGALLPERKQEVVYNAY